MLPGCQPGGSAALPAGRGDAGCGSSGGAGNLTGSGRGDPSRTAAGLDPLPEPCPWTAA